MEKDAQNVPLEKVLKPLALQYPIESLRSLMSSAVPVCRKHFIGIDRFSA